MSLRAAPLHLHFLGSVAAAAAHRIQESAFCWPGADAEDAFPPRQGSAYSPDFSSRAWAALLPPGPADWLLDSGV